MVQYNGSASSNDAKSFNNNPFRNKWFYIAYAATLVVLYAILLLLRRGFASEDLPLVILVLSIAYVVAGLIVWALIKQRNVAVSLGVLLGSQTPFVAVCILTGGFGLYLHWL
jgi:glucose dehydrogenase